MSRIHVCALSRIHSTSGAIGARSLVTLININTEVQRPIAIGMDQHLFLGMSDIAAPEDGEVTPSEIHVKQLIAFVERWDRQHPLLIHCYAGVSRSTAAAYISVCALDKGRSEHEIALRLRALSPTATPNPLLVSIADEMLGRKGRMSAAMRAIGRGVECSEGVPFSLAVPRLGAS